MVWFLDLKIQMPNETTPTTVTLPVVTHSMATPAPALDDGADAAAAAGTPPTPPRTYNLTRPESVPSELVRLKIVTAAPSTGGTGSGSSYSSYTGTHTPYGSYGAATTPTPPAPRLVGAMGNNTHRAALGLPVLPDAVVTTLQQLDHDFLEGELTQKGYDRRVQSLLAPFTPTATPAASPTAPATSAPPEAAAAGSAAGAPAAGAAGDAGAGSAASSETDNAAAGPDAGARAGAGAGARTLLAMPGTLDALGLGYGMTPSVDADSDGDDEEPVLVNDPWSEYRTRLVRAFLLAADGCMDPCGSR